MEPDQALYSQWLKPLVERPGSTYSLVPESGIIWTDLETIMNKEHLPFQEAYPAGDPRLYEVNKTLLVVANLAFHPEKPYKGFASLTRMVLYQFLSAVKANSLFHRYGLVRMLLWVGDDERTKLLPRAVGNRKKSEVEMEMACSKVTEIASSTNVAVVPRLGRDPHLDFMALPQVLKTMNEKGITIPTGRESLLITEWAQGSSKFLSEYKALPYTVACLKEIHKELQTGIGSLSENELQKKLKAYKAKRSMLITHYRKTQKLLDLLGIEEAIVVLEKKLYRNTDSVEVGTIKQDLASLRDQHETISLTYLNNRDLEELSRMADNSRALHEQLMFWDQRDFEPLRAHAHEFFPSKEMALINLIPASLPVIRENYPESDEVLEFILAHLFLQPTRSLKAGLKSLWPGASDWLIEHCPSLTDPNKGGWADLDKISIRRLTAGMCQEILEAWFEWPWRPTRFDIMHRLGSVNHDPDAITEDD